MIHDRTHTATSAAKLFSQQGESPAYVIPESKKLQEQISCFLLHMGERPGVEICCILLGHMSYS